MDAFPTWGVLFAVAAAIWLAIALWRRTNLRRKLAARREKLVAKYGEVIAEKIIARKVWQGMTSEQLIESWGQPEDLDEKVLKAKTKEIWKYGCNGKNRYRQRVYVENNEVVGWQSQ